MKNVHVCFFWHMHQPYYTDLVTGSARMLWMRLHATKANYDMAYLLEKIPAARATFNFTPSLLLQLQEKWGTGFYTNPVSPEESAKFLREAEL